MNLEKVKDYLTKEKNPYVLKIDDMLVTIEYTESNKSFNECMLNILKQKSKLGWLSLLSTLELIGGRWVNGKKIKIWY